MEISMKKLALLFISFSLFACANQSSLHQSPSGSNQPKIASPNAVDQNLVELNIEAPAKINKLRESEKSVYLELGVIKGALYGAPEYQPNWYTDLYANGKLELNLSEVEANLSRYAEVLNTHKFSQGLKVVPSSTKLVRASTFGANANKQKYFSGGLKDEKGNFFFLVYFDRACNITGETDFGAEGIFKHNINIPTAGLYRISIAGQPGQPDKIKIVTASQSDKPITVFLNN